MAENPPGLTQFSVRPCRRSSIAVRILFLAPPFLARFFSWLRWVASPTGWGSPYVTYAGIRKPQPVPFSHQHHVTGFGIDCRYCHTSVETSSNGRHSSDQDLHEQPPQTWTNAALLEPVRASSQVRRVACNGRLSASFPDFVYFNHSIHVIRVTAAIPAGPVDKMPLMSANGNRYRWGRCLQLPSRDGKRSAPARSGIQHAALPAADQRASGGVRW